VLNVESAIKTHSLKASHPQPSRQTTAAESGQSTFESMLDDNAAKATAAAKDKEQSAATDRTQKGPAPKAKSDKPAADGKPADDQPAPKTATVDKPPETAEPEAPVVAVDKTAAVETEVPVEAAEVNETAPETEAAPTEALATPVATNAVPVIPVQTLTPADAQPAAPEATAEAITQAPVIAAANAQKPIETSELAGQPVETDETGKPLAEKKEQPVKAEQTAEGEQTAAQPQEQAHAEKGKAPHVALTDAEKEHIARARGEGTEKADQTATRGKGEQADAGNTVQKATTDVPTQQVQAPATHSMSATAAAATPTVVPQAAAQTPVPLSGVGVEIASKAASGAKEFEIRLDPPELGRIEVRLNVDRDGNVTSRLIADRQDTLDLLKRDSSGLERALQDAGLKTSDNGMQFSLRDQSLAQQQNEGNGKSNTTRVVVPDEALPTVEAPVQSYGRLTGRAGGLDIRV